MRTCPEVSSKFINCSTAALCCLLFTSYETSAASVQETDFYGGQTTHNASNPSSSAAINGAPPTAPATSTFSKSTVTIISGSFEPIADEPGPREGHVVAAYNSMIWSFTGVNDLGPAPPVGTYTPETNTWKEVADSQAPFGEVLFHSGCQVYETVYMYVDSPESGNNGGWDSSTRCDKIVPEEECPPLPTYSYTKIYATNLPPVTSIRRLISARNNSRFPGVIP